MDALHLIRALGTLTSQLLDASAQAHLLNADGHVPEASSYTELLQHTADAQDLSREVTRPTADFARSPHSTNRAGGAVLGHLATAASAASHAAPLFAETAEIAHFLHRASGPTDRAGRDNCMVIQHATARAHLRRASELLRDAGKELDEHLDLRSFKKRARPENPAPPPPGPSCPRR